MTQARMPPPVNCCTANYCTGENPTAMAAWKHCASSNADSPQLRQTLHPVDEKRRPRTPAAAFLCPLDRVTSISAQIRNSVAENRIVIPIAIPA